MFCSILCYYAFIISQQMWFLSGILLYIKLGVHRSVAVFIYIYYITLNISLIIVSVDSGNTEARRGLFYRTKIFSVVVGLRTDDVDIILYDNNIYYYCYFINVVFCIYS